MLNGVYLQVSPLAVPSTWVTISGVPLFVPNEVLERELQRFGKLASSGPLVLTGWLRGARSHQRSAGGGGCRCSIDRQRSTGAQSYSGDLYMLEKVNDFLDETFGKSLKVKEYFPDAEKCIKSVLTNRLIKEKGSKRLKLKSGHDECDNIAGCFSSACFHVVSLSVWEAQGEGWL